MKVIKKKICLNNDKIHLQNEFYRIVINLQASYQNIGLQNNVIEEWSNGECYSHQAWTIFNNEVYKLKEGVEDSICGNLHDCTKEIYFDDTKWDKISFDKTNIWLGKSDAENKDDSINNVKITSESRLKEFQLICSTDNMGNTLHGIIEGDYTMYENSDEVMNYPYKPNTIVNISTIDDSSEETNAKYIFANILSNIDEDSTQNTVTFTYYIGAILDLKSNEPYDIKNFKLNSNTEASAIRYTETYQIVTESELFFKNKNTWFEIKYKKLIPLNTYTYQILNTNNKITSPIANLYYFDSAKYNKFNFKEENNHNEYHNLGIILDEDIGIAYPHNITKEVSIERGTSNFYERHLILGNVKTFEALQQYSNGYFKIIDNNNL